MAFTNRLLLEIVLLSVITESVVTIWVEMEVLSSSVASMSTSVSSRSVVEASFLVFFKCRFERNFLFVESLIACRLHSRIAFSHIHLFYFGNQNKRCCSFLVPNL